MLKRKRYQGGGSVSGLSVLPQASDIAFQPVVGVLPLTGQEFAQGLRNSLAVQQVAAYHQEKMREEERRSESQRRLINNALVEVSDPIFNLKTYSPYQRKRLEEIAGKYGVKLGELPATGTIEDLEGFTRKVSKVTSDPEFVKLAGETETASKLLEAGTLAANQDPAKFDIDAYNKAIEAYRSDENGSVGIASISPQNFRIQPSLQEQVFDRLSAEDQLQLIGAAEQANAQAVANGTPLPVVDMADKNQLIDFYRSQDTQGSYLQQFAGDNAAGQDFIRHATARGIDRNDQAAIHSLFRELNKPTSSGGGTVGVDERNLQKKVDAYMRENNLDPSERQDIEDKIRLGTIQTPNSPSGKDRITELYGSESTELGFAARDLQRAGVDIFDSRVTAEIRKRVKETGEAEFSETDIQKLIEITNPTPPPRPYVPGTLENEVDKLNQQNLDPFGSPPVQAPAPSQPKKPGISKYYQ